MKRRPTLIGIPAPKRPAPVGHGVYQYINPRTPKPIVPQPIVIINET